MELDAIFLYFEILLTFFFILIQRKVLINKGYGINMNQCHHVRNSVQNVFNVMHQHIKNIKQSKPYLISRCSLIVGVATFKQRKHATACILYFTGTETDTSETLLLYTDSHIETTGSLSKRKPCRQFSSPAFITVRSSVIFISQIIDAQISPLKIFHVQQKEIINTLGMTTKHEEYIVHNDKGFMVRIERSKKERQE